MGTKHTMLKYSYLSRRGHVEVRMYTMEVVNGGHKL